MAAGGDFNYFGAVEADVANLFASNSYSAAAALADMGGSTVVDTVLQRIAREVAETFEPMAYQRLVQRVHGEIIIFSAKGGETSGTLTLGPTVSVNGQSSIHIWRSGGPRTDEMVVGQEEYFAWTQDSTGQIITPATAMVRTEYLYASYVVNVEDPAFTLPSVKDKVILGAGAELGERLYIDKTQPWQVVESLKARWQEWRSNALESRWVPDEMRRMLFWSPLDRANDKAGSVRFGRA